MYGVRGVLTCTSDKIHLYDLRKPSLVISETEFEREKQNGDEINDIDIYDLSMASSNKFWSAACDDSGALLVNEYVTSEEDHARFQVS